MQALLQQTSDLLCATYGGVGAGEREIETSVMPERIISRDRRHQLMLVSLVYPPASVSNRGHQGIDSFATECFKNPIEWLTAG